MRNLTSWFVLTAPLAILAADALIYYFDGYSATITAVVRGWAEQSSWPEFVFLLGCVLLYAHLFRGWP